MQSILHITLLGNTLINWILALCGAALVWLMLKAIRHTLSKKLARRFEQTHTLLDDLVYRVSKRTWTYLRIAAAITTLSALLAVGTEFRILARTVALILSIIQIALWGTDVINLWVTHRIKLHIKEDASVATKMNALGIISKILLWSVLVLTALDNIPNVEVSTLIASLGIGSIAVALAVQNILGDLFASLSIVFDKPFEVGDFINVGEYSGSVEYIGLKSTRLRSLTGEQLIFANSDLLNSRIRNYKRMNKRRVSFTIGVSPETSYEKLNDLPSLLQNIIEEQVSTTFDRAHFKAYGDFTLDFEVVYYVDSPDYQLFMNAQQNINLEIYRRFQELEIELPYPTQAVLIRNST